MLWLVFQVEYAAHHEIAGCFLDDPLDVRKTMIFSVKRPVWLIYTNTFLCPIEFGINIGRIGKDIVIDAVDLFEEITIKDLGTREFNVILQKILLDSFMVCAVDLLKMDRRTGKCMKDRDTDTTRACAKIENK
jgi:hypothetical protein